MITRVITHHNINMTLGYITPITWEQQYHQLKANPAAQVD